MTIIDSPLALEAQPQIDPVDDPAGNQFNAVAWRPEAEWTEEATDQTIPPVTGVVTGEVTGEVKRLAEAMQGEMKRSELQAALGLKHEDHFREAYLRPALDAGVVEMTIPDKPRSSRQKYRLTALGQALLKPQQGKKE